MPIVKFLPSGREIEVAEGITVLQAEQQAGIRQDAPCGGHGTCSKCKVWINGREVLACRTEITEDMTVTAVSELKDAEILSAGMQTGYTMQPVQTGAFHMGIDIGTTTVVAYLLDGENGSVLGTESMMNPQYVYGADVISRIQAAMAGNMQELSEKIRTGVWSLMMKLCRNHNKKIEDAGTVAVVANPAMQQLFFGRSPENLSRPPFAPVYTEPEILSMADYFPVSGTGKLLLIPDIAGYVGADTLGCILSTGMYRETKMTLLIDIGTNGELVLGNSRSMVACSTAAGPALEGGRISCGMRGSRGAVDHVWLEDGEIRCSVIGNEAAEGICGSGIIDAAAVMLELGILNKRGRIQSSYREDGKERVFDLTEQLSLTQSDIRELQMAKGAIAAGIQILMNCLEVTEEEIDQVILCGAFGTYMNAENACRIGMIPEALLKKIKPGGNAAGMGSIQMALDQKLFGLTKQILEKTEAVELASFSEFQRIYAAKMMFKERKK